MEPHSDGMDPDGPRSTPVTQHSPRVTPRRPTETQAKSSDDVGVNQLGVRDSYDRAASHFDLAFTSWPEGEIAIGSKPRRLAIGLSTTIGRSFVKPCRRTM